MCYTPEYRKGMTDCPTPILPTTSCAPDVSVCINSFVDRYPVPNTFITQTEKRCSGFLTNEYASDDADTLMTVGELSAFWNTNFRTCVENYNAILYSNPDGSYAYNPDNVPRLQDDFYILLDLAFGDNLENFNYTANTDLQRNLLRACQQVPGACDAYLTNHMCRNFDYDELTENPSVVNWCGCYIPPDNADTLTSSISCAQVTPNGNRGIYPCYPLCHRIDTVPLFDPNSGDEYACNNNVCVMDNVSLNVINSTIGGVNINQVCPSCSPTELCECIISSNDLPETFDEMGISTSFTQYCGSGVCYVLEPDGTLTSVTCTDYIGTSSGSGWIWIIVLVIVAVFIILIVGAVFFAVRADHRNVTEEVTIHHPSKHEREAE